MARLVLFAALCIGVATPQRPTPDPSWTPYPYIKTAPPYRPPQSTPEPVAGPSAPTPQPPQPTPAPLSPLPTQWCDNDASCQRHGDAGALCLSHTQQCLCSAQFDNVRSADGEVAYICLPRDIANGSIPVEETVMVTRFPAGDCDAFQEDPTHVRTLIEHHESVFGKRVVSYAYGCGSVHFSATLEMSPLELGALRTEAVTSALEAAVQGGALRDILGSGLSTRAVVVDRTNPDCNTTNAAVALEDTIDGVQTCVALSCETGYRKSSTDPVACVPALEGTLDRPCLRDGDCTFEEEAMICDLATSQCAPPPPTPMPAMVVRTDAPSTAVPEASWAMRTASPAGVPVPPSGVANPPEGMNLENIRWCKTDKDCEVYGDSDARCDALTSRCRCSEGYGMRMVGLVPEYLCSPNTPDAYVEELPKKVVVFHKFKKGNCAAFKRPNGLEKILNIMELALKRPLRSWSLLCGSVNLAIEVEMQTKELETLTLVTKDVQDILVEYPDTAGDLGGDLENDVSIIPEGDGEAICNIPNAKVTSEFHTSAGTTCSVNECHAEYVKNLTETATLCVSFTDNPDYRCYLDSDCGGRSRCVDGVCTGREEVVEADGGGDQVLPIVLVVGGVLMPIGFCLWVRMAMVRNSRERDEEEFSSPGTEAAMSDAGVPTDYPEDMAEEAPPRHAFSMRNCPEHLSMNPLDEQGLGGVKPGSRQSTDLVGKTGTSGQTAEFLIGTHSSSVPTPDRTGSSSQSQTRVGDTLTGQSSMTGQPLLPIFSQQSLRHPTSQWVSRSQDRITLSSSDDMPHVQVQDGHHAPSR